MRGLSLNAIYHGGDRVWGGCGRRVRTRRGYVRELVEKRRGVRRVLRSGGKDDAQGRSKSFAPFVFAPIYQTPFLSNSNFSQSQLAEDHKVN